MAADALAAARAFLCEAHHLSPDEAAEALAVAAEVLDAGLARLNAAARSGDGPGCVAAAHALKGNFLNLGLAMPAALAGQVMERAAADDCDAAKNAVAALTTVLRPILALGPEADASSPR